MHAAARALRPQPTAALSGLRRAWLHFAIDPAPSARAGRPRATPGAARESKTAHSLRAVLAAQDRARRELAPARDRRASLKETVLAVAAWADALDATAGRHAPLAVDTVYCEIARTCVAAGDVALGEAAILQRWLKKHWTPAKRRATVRRPALAVIEAHAEAGNFESALRVVAAVEAAGLPLGVGGRAPVIRGLCRRGDARKALVVLDEALSMRHAQHEKVGSVPRGICDDILAAAARSKAADRSDALRAALAMYSHTVGMGPSALVVLASAAGSIAELRALVSDFAALPGFVHTPATVEAVVGACVRLGDIRAGLYMARLTSQTKGRGPPLVPSTQCFELLIDACAREGMDGAARRLLATLTSHGREPTPRSLASLVRACGNAGNGAGVTEAWRRVLELSGGPTRECLIARVQACIAMDDRAQFGAALAELAARCRGRLPLGDMHALLGAAMRTGRPWYSARILAGVSLVGRPTRTTSLILARTLRSRGDALYLPEFLGWLVGAGVHESAFAVDTIAPAVRAVFGADGATRLAVDALQSLSVGQAEGMRAQVAVSALSDALETGAARGLAGAMGAIVRQQKKGGLYADAQRAAHAVDGAVRAVIGYKRLRERSDARRAAGGTWTPALSGVTLVRRFESAGSAGR